MPSDLIDIKFNAAINEIIAEAQLPLNKEIIETWLSDYVYLWDEMKAELGTLPVPLDIFHSRSMCEFEAIYSRFKALKKYFNYEAACYHAMAEYSQIMAVDDNATLLKDWVFKYVKMGLKELVIPPIELGSLNCVSTINGVTYFVAGEEFKNCRAFYTAFQKLFYEDEILPYMIARIEKEMQQ